MNVCLEVLSDERADEFRASSKTTSFTGVIDSGGDLVWKRDS